MRNYLNFFMEKREVVCIAIVNENRELLVQKREQVSSKWGEEWSFFGGGIEEGETPELALKREAMEELWLDLNEKEFSPIWKTERYSGKVGKYYIRTLYLIKTTKKESDFVDQEAQGAYFKNFDEVTKLKFVTPIEQEIFIIKQAVWVQ